jgi:uncharacterized protein with HEPN domain
MKELGKDLNLLLDSLYWIKRINTVYQKNYEDPEDYKDLICKNLENIGISLGEVSDKTRSLFLYSKEDWKKIIGFRNISAHTYKIINMKIVLDIVKNKVPELKNNIVNIFKSLIKEADENNKPIEFEFDKNVYSLNYTYPYDKVVITINGESFNSKSIPKKNIEQAIDNIITDKEITFGISLNNTLNS